MKHKNKKSEKESKNGNEIQKKSTLKMIAKIDHFILYFLSDILYFFIYIPKRLLILRITYIYLKC